ncbi:MAG: hypothetical protein SVX43_19025 [Cyanobacteriota bacterium]|nr:hypothetical protein [Cyanobacteriota bacterium]
MPANDIEWSDSEKKLARAAFDKAYEREINALLQTVRDRSNEIAEPEELWKLHDFLSAKRHELDGKYDYRYSFLLFVFAQLVKDGWLSLSELDGLDASKRAKVAALTRM